MNLANCVILDSLVMGAAMQVVFEEFGFKSFHCAPAPVFSLRRMTNLYPNLPAAQVSNKLGSRARVLWQPKCVA